MWQLGSCGMAPPSPSRKWAVICISSLWACMYTQFLTHPDHYQLGFRTGMGKPTVFGPWVMWVQVQSTVLNSGTHVDTIPVTTVLQVLPVFAPVVQSLHHLLSHNCCQQWHPSTTTMTFPLQMSRRALSMYPHHHTYHH